MEEVKKPTMYCSFCGKSQYDIRALIAGPTVFICNECIELCVHILATEQNCYMTPEVDRMIAGMSYCAHKQGVGSMYVYGKLHGPYKHD